MAEEAEHIYLDLADEHWRAVEIGPDGWQVTASPPVRFHRRAGILPLPVPERGGSIEVLLPLLNLSNRNDFVLVVAWLLAALRARGPYPLLAISRRARVGQDRPVENAQGLGRSQCRPGALPREERELMIAANNGYLLAFDNLSGLPTWLSDALCRLASGGSFAARQLYTDDDEILFQAAPAAGEWHRGHRQPSGFGRPWHFSDVAANSGAAPPLRDSAMARLREGATLHSGRPA